MWVSRWYKTENKNNDIKYMYMYVRTNVEIYIHHLHPANIALICMILVYEHQYKHFVICLTFWH